MAARQVQGWESSVHSLEHLTLSQRDLLKKREQMRKALVPSSDIIPTEWRFVVVVGPAGSGKSAYIKAEMERLGYQGLIPSTPFAAAAVLTDTNRPVPYVLTHHKILLLVDSISTRGANDLIRAEALAADTLLVFLHGGGRADHSHADAALLGWRLHSHMRIVFVAPKADQLLLSKNKGPRSPAAYLAAMKQRMAGELHGMMVPYVATKAADLGVRLAPDVQLFLQKAAAEVPATWANMMLQEGWVAFRATSTAIAAGTSSSSRGSGVPADHEAVLRAEGQELQSVVFGVGGGFVTGLTPGVESGSSPTMATVPSVASRSVSAVKDEGTVHELQAAQMQARTYLRLLLPYLEAKLAREQVAVTLWEWVVLLHSSNPMVNELATAAIKSQSYDSPSNQAAIADAGAIRPLVQLLSSSRQSVQQNACGALRNLSLNPVNRLPIAEAGAIGPLVRLLSSTSTALLERAAATIAQLSICDTNQAPIADAGVIPPLVWLLASGSSGAQACAAATLKNLAQSGTNAAVIARAGGIPPLLQLLQSGRPEVVEHAAGALHNLAHVDKVKVEITKAGGIKPLVKLLDDSSRGATPMTTGTLTEVSGALQFLARNSSMNRTAIAKAYGIKPLVQLLSSNDPALQSQAAGALWELGIADDNEIAIAEAGAIPRLVQMIRSPDSSVHYDAVGVLYVLSFHDDHKKAIEKEGGIPALVRLLDSSNMRVQEFAAKTLDNMAQYRRAFRKTIQAEGAPSKLRQLLRCNSNSVCQAAQGALSRLGE